MGYCDSLVRDTENKKIDNVVISVMSGGELLSKGITDINGDFVTSVNLEGITEVKVFANKGGFIQGNKIVSVQSHNENLSITSLSLNQNSANAIPTIGELISVSITLKNTTDETLYPSNGALFFLMEHIQIISQLKFQKFHLARVMY